MTPTPPPAKNATSERHIPIRSCVVCRRRAEKRDLLRFRRTSAGTWRLDPGGKAGGRGAWICGDCARTRPAKGLRRAFRGQSDDIRTQLERHLGPEDAPQRPTTPTRIGGMHG